MIEFHNVSFTYRKIPALTDVSLSVASGEFLGVFGPNGGGKTTLLKLLMGFLTPQQGLIRILGKKPEEVRHRIGYVPQLLRTDPDFPITVSELIALGQLARRPWVGGFRAEEWDAAEFWIEKLGLLEHREKAYGELSGGLAQRALLARALIGDPDILLLDEPTANIDVCSLAVVIRVLEELKSKKTILLITHDLNHILKRADRLLCVQRTLSFLRPEEVCSHFSLGLYHLEETSV
jgi:zinc transport system ATP-binding protein